MFDILCLVYLLIGILMHIDELFSVAAVTTVETEETRVIRGRVPNVFGKQGRNKRMRFSIHFDANSEEFNQLVQTDYLNLVGHPALPPPQAPLDPPLQPHPSIVDFPEPPMQPTNDGWEKFLQILLLA
jgi:hypothetical protein